MKTTVEKESAPKGEHPAAMEFVTPEVNIFESNEGYVLEAEMPGVAKEGLEITLDGTELTITGRRNGTSLPGEALLRESRGVDYRRAFELDPAIDGSRVSAKMDQGVLTLTLPKLEKAKPRRVAVE